jgi:hypothetical protein
MWFLLLLLYYIPPWLPVTKPPQDQMAANRNGLIVFKSCAAGL